MNEKPHKYTNELSANTEGFQRWLGYKGKWKDPSEKKPRKPRTWILPEFNSPLDRVYIAKGVFTRRYKSARMVSGLSKIAKAAVMAGALVLCESDREWKGTKLRKIVRYNNTFVPRMLTDKEREDYLLSEIEYI
jgi:hypothetical protein